jgi:uncharacterized protein
MLERVPQQFRELQEITMQTDTRDILAHATRQAESHEDYFLVDIDAHVTETSFWPEILALIDNDVIRQMGEANAARPGNANHSLLNHQPGILHQHLYGRIPHQQGLLEPIEKKGTHRFTELARRAMDALGLDYQIVFPTPMLTLGMHPQDEMEVALGAGPARDGRVRRSFQKLSAPQTSSACAPALPWRAAWRRPPDPAGQ